MTDKAYGVGKNNRANFGHFKGAHGGIEGGKELISSVNIGTRQPIKQSGFAGVSVAH